MQEDFFLAARSLTVDGAMITDASTGFCYDEVVLVIIRPDPSSGAGWTFFLRLFH